MLSMNEYRYSQYYDNFSKMWLTIKLRKLSDQLKQIEDELYLSESLNLFQDQIFQLKDVISCNRFKLASLEKKNLTNETLILAEIDNSLSDLSLGIEKLKEESVNDYALIYC